MTGKSPFALMSLLVLCPLLILAQDFQRLESHAPIPAEFLVSSSEKYEKLQTGNKQKDAFQLQSQFLIDELLQSGKVLFNDPVSQYINQVADQLLRHDPSLRKKLRFYAVKSPEANAFATDRGTIFVNLGLLARLETEAQLAFILSHEIIHFTENHNFQAYKKEQFLGQNSSPTKASYNFLLDKSLYSRELEMEADQKGLELFLKSGYSSESLENIFKILQYSHLPFADIPFKKAFLETRFIKFPQDYFLEKVTKPVAQKSGDPFASHPNAIARELQILKQIKNKPIEGKSFLLPEFRFEKAQELSRYEMAELLLQERRYAEAIYQSFLLYENYTNSNYFNKINAKALYGLAQYRNVKRKSEVQIPWRKTQGHIQQVHFLLDKLSDKELNVLATAHCWQNKMNNSTDLAAAGMAEDMLTDMVFYHIKNPQQYFKKSVKNEALLGGQDFESYAFIHYMNRSDFRQTLIAVENYSKKVHIRGFSPSYNGWNKKRPVKKAGTKAKNKEVSSLGLNKVLFVNPLFVQLDHRKENPIQFLENEKNKQNLISIIEKNSKKLDLATEILDLKSIDPNLNIDAYNDRVRLTEWLEERVAHELNMQCSNQEFMEAIVEKYGTSQIAFTGAISQRFPRKKLDIALSSGLSLLLPPTLPVAIKNALEPRHESFVFTVVYDLIYNEELMVYTQEMPLRGEETMIGSNLYYAMQQMK